jgi:hypothetical protein
MLSYQHLVAAVFGLKTMPAMDQACFISTSKSHINYMNFCLIDGNFRSEDLKRIYAEVYLGKFEKLRYNVVYKFGDIYYEP